MKILLWLQVQVLHTKKYKDAFDSIIQCLEERFYQNTARKKKGFFHDFANFSISENTLKFHFIPERFIPS